LGVGSKLDYLSNGYPRLVDINTAYPKEMVSIYEVSEIPDEVSSGKFCYTSEKGFYENPDWKEPYDIDAEVKKLEQTISELKLALCEIYESLPNTNSRSLIMDKIYSSLNLSD